MTAFDYQARAELYPSRSKTRARQTAYHRFDTAADAIRFAIENLPPDLLRGAVLEVEDDRYDQDAIRSLYLDSAYPLKRSDAS